MNQLDRQELERLKSQHQLLQNRLAEVETLRDQLSVLASRIAQLEQRLIAEPSPAIQPAETKAEAPPSPVPQAKVPEILPPLVPATEPAKITLGDWVKITPEPTRAPQAQTPLVPPVIGPTASSKVPAQPSQPPEAPKTPPPPPPIYTRQPAKKSFEMQLGTYWLVRIGIVMLLTGLVFLANLAYKKWIISMGPGGKVAMLYLVGAALLGVGFWLYRKSEALKNYAQVLLAGGLAEIYFTTYAAHHFTFLQVIKSPVVDALLLLVCAGVTVALASWKKAEVLALFAIVLSYYNAAITNVGAFTLYSNLVLAAAAVFFLVRNRWATVSVISLAATYATYAFWRFYGAEGWVWPAPEVAVGVRSLWFGACFLASYWLIFTVAVFASRHEKMVGQTRATFLSLNNGAFFALFVLTMWLVRTGGFWKVALIFGLVLLAMAALARRLLSAEPLTRNTYLTQGLFFVTLGFVTYFTGAKLGVVLALESVVLLHLGRLSQSKILRVGGFVCAALATGFALSGISRFDNTGLILGIVTGLAMVFNAWREEQFKASKEDRWMPQSLFFCALGLLTWFVVTWQNTSADWRAVALGAEALAFTASWHWLRLRPLTALGQLFAVLAQLYCGVLLIENGLLLPWWNPALLIILTLALSHWWQRQQEQILPREHRYLVLACYAAAFVALLFLWLRLHVSDAPWLALCSGMAVALTAYGLLSRLWMIAAFGQLFLLAAVFQFAGGFLDRDLQPVSCLLALTPILVLWGLSLAVVAVLARNPSIDQRVTATLPPVGIVYRAVAVLLSLCWIFEYIPAPHRFWFMILVAGLFFLWNVWRPGREPLVISGVFVATALVPYFSYLGTPAILVSPLNLLAILFLLAQQQVARRRGVKLEEAVHSAMIFLGCLLLWIYLSIFVRHQSGGFGFYLTAAWAALALAIFVVGFLLRERLYRWVGLGILGFALVRVILFDVWRLETVYRILSFMALGIVLLLLGFIYNKYQEKIKEWL